MSRPQSADPRVIKTCAQTLSVPGKKLAPVELTDADDLDLEEVEGKKALQWVREQNEKSLSRLESDPRLTRIRDSLLKASNSPDRLPSFSLRKGAVYDFWQDEANPKGLLRRLSYGDFMAGKRAWETILDIDVLAEKENENWVYKEGHAFGSRHLLILSRDGKDAAAVREYDIETKQFVQNGFVLPEGKHQIAWIDHDTVLVGLAGADHPEELTDSGYPRTVRLWKRGVTVEEAPVIMTIAKTDMAVSMSVVRDETDGPARHIFLRRQRDFYTADSFLLQPGGGLVQLQIPPDAQHTVDRGFLYVKTMSAWKFGRRSFPAGTLLRFQLADYLRGRGVPEILFTSKHESILDSYTLLNGRIFLTVKRHVVNRVVELVRSNGQFGLRPILKNSEPYVMQSIYMADPDQGVLVLSEEGYLTPPTRTLVSLKDNTTSRIDRAKEWFDARPYMVEQNFATSKDGTKVPYFIVRRKDMKFDGKQPVLQYGYGGFLVSEEPYYSLGFGQWLEQGGVLVVANIRGGGEYGPEWHDAALKENRQRAYDDFHAVAEDLSARKITSARHRGVMGGSNGGLLAGVAFTQRPDLYSAAVVGVPLLDMLRYHLLHAGASWMAEYGNPDDPAMAAEIRKYSPYHNLKAGVRYLEPFFTTSTADDRVHPAHARRMAARMQRLGLPFLYFENMEGGHAGSTNAEQSARLQALEFVYLLQKLKN